MSGMTDARKRVCVVTPYFKEDRAMIERCMDSVRRQTIPTEHILVADGFPQDWLSKMPVRHITLDRPHADFGNLARGMGAMMAIAEKYSAITFLDADNWYDNDHIESCLTALKTNPRCLFAAAQRRFVRPDGTVMATVTPAELPHHEHIDTNCFFFLPRLYYLLHHWCTMPQELSESGDHLFYLLLAGSYAPAIVPKQTVNYTCMVEQIYREKGEEPPPGAKPAGHWKDRQAWLNGLSAEEFVQVKLLTGLNLFQEPARRGGRPAAVEF
jgi:hypothetical protein